jgi:ATP-dependent Clp protease ATP-binding subunit ClpA
MAKVIQEKIKNALMNELPFGKLQKGGEVTVDAEGGKAAFKYVLNA